MEVWRDVVGYESVYQVSNFGRVRRILGPGGAAVKRVLKPGTVASGVKNVNLSFESQPRSYTVHRLVAHAFLGTPPSERHQIAHNDGNPANNRLANLRWATPAENAFDQVRHGTQKGKHYGRPTALTEAQVLAIRADHRTEASVAPDYGISPATVGQIRRRETYKYLPPIPGDYEPERPRRRFSDDDIRALRADPRSSRDLAAVLSCAPVTVWAIKTRRAYAHVPDVPAPPAVEEPVPEAPLNRIRIMGSVGMLDMPKGETALLDAEDAETVRTLRWNTVAGKYTRYVVTQRRYNTGVVKTLALHRFLMDPPEGMVVDHINGDGLDNRRANLRIVTVAQNNLNSRVRKDSASGLKGAFYDKRRDCFYSRIKVDGVNTWLGMFDTAEEAAEAYAEASLEHHGEFGRTHRDG